MKYRVRQKGNQFFPEWSRFGIFWTPFYGMHDSVESNATLEEAMADIRLFEAQRKAEFDKNNQVEIIHKVTL